MLPHLVAMGMDVRGRHAWLAVPLALTACTSTADEQPTPAPTGATAATTPTPTPTSTPVEPVDLPLDLGGEYVSVSSLVTDSVGTHVIRRTSDGFDVRLITSALRVGQARPLALPDDGRTITDATGSDVTDRIIGQYLTDDGTFADVVWEVDDGEVLFTTPADGNINDVADLAGEEVAIGEMDSRATLWVLPGGLDDEPTTIDLGIAGTATAATEVDGDVVVFVTDFEDPAEPFTVMTGPDLDSLAVVDTPAALANANYVGTVAGPFLGGRSTDRLPRVWSVVDGLAGAVDVWDEFTDGNGILDREGEITRLRITRNVLYVEDGTCPWWHHLDDSLERLGDNSGNYNCNYEVVIDVPARHVLRFRRNTVESNDFGDRDENDRPVWNTVEVVDPNSVQVSRLVQFGPGDEDWVTVIRGAEDQTVRTSEGAVGTLPFTANVTSVVRAPDGAVLLVGREITESDTPRIWRIADGTLTEVMDSDAFGYAASVTDVDGQLVAVGRLFGEDNEGLLLSTSDDGGLTWSPHGEPADPTLFGWVSCGGDVVQQYPVDGEGNGIATVSATGLTTIAAFDDTTSSCYALGERVAVTGVIDDADILLLGDDGEERLDYPDGLGTFDEITTDSKGRLVVAGLAEGSSTLATWTHDGDGWGEPVPQYDRPFDDLVRDCHAEAAELVCSEVTADSVRVWRVTLDG